MTRLHARDPEERWKGLDAFETVYAAGGGRTALPGCGRIRGCGGCSTGSTRGSPVIASPCRTLGLHRLVGSLIRAGAGGLRM